MKSTIRDLGLESAAKFALVKWGLKEIVCVDEISKFHSQFKNLNDTDKAIFEQESGITYENGLKFIEYIEKNSRNSVVGSIKTVIEKDDPSLFLSLCLIPLICEAEEREREKGQGIGTRKSY